MTEKIKLNSMIQAAENFQYAINIAYDFSDVHKIENYIPTNDAIRIIEDVLLSTKVNSTDRARLFVGAYGKGKSHLALMLIALVYKKDYKIFNNLLAKIKIANKDLFEYLDSYIQSENRLLPVIVEGNKVSLQQSLLNALRNALERENICNIMPKTFFNIAIDTIQLWEESYKSTYKRFISMIDCTASEFVKKLKNFEHDALDKFTEIYPELTAGSRFSPILNGDVVSLYSDVIQEIEKYGYNGIFLVYDEFSKYLEGNVNTTTASDIKVLQDLAEKANRSGNKQLHLLMISHKSIINYVDELPKVKIDAWKAVSERFKNIELSNSPIQLYDLISHVIIKDNKQFLNYYNKNKALFDNVLNSYANSNMFSSITKDELNTTFIGCYPLEPTSLFMLPSISEKVAQNERSMFTFLSSKNDKNALYNLLNKGANYITPDYIYDYFNEQFKNEAYTSDVHKYWKLVITSINLLSNPNELQVKLIKCLALIYILDKKELIKPSSDNLLTIYSTWGYSRNEIIKNIEELKNIGIFKYSSRTHYLRLSERTDINIEDTLKDMIERRKLTFDPIGILNAESKNVFLYPIKYNDTNEIIRYFTFEFISPEQCEEVVEWDKRIADKYATGTFFVIFDKDKSNGYEWVKKISNIRVVFVVISNAIKIEDILKQYDALSILIENSDDELYKEELMYAFDDVNVILRRYIEAALNPSLNEAIYYHQGKRLNITRRSQLSNVLSEICDTLYVNAPVIVNEVINKNNVTNQAINSRNKVLEGLLENKVKENLGLSGTGQDVSFFRSIIKNNGIFVGEGENYSIVTDKLPDDRLNFVLKVIKDFFLSTTVEGSKNLGILYKQLTEVQAGIGLKLGIIPFFVAATLHSYKRFVVITKKNREISISASLLDSINENPSQYEVILESWSKEKEDYISKLEDVFESYLIISEKEYNTFDYIVRAMQRWFYRVPKYSKEAEISISNIGQGLRVKSVKQFRQGLRVPEINSREFLFEKIPRIFGYSEVNENLADDIKNAKEIIDQLLYALQEDIATALVKELSNNKEESRPLYTVTKDWYESLESKTKEHLFANGEGKLLSIIGNVHNDINELVKKIGRELSGLHIEDWNDDTFDKVKIALKQQVESIESFNSNSSSDYSDSQYKIVLTDNNGKEIEKTFNKTEISSKGKMLYNELISNINEYGFALSEGEKRQILMNVMMGFMK